MLVLSSEYRVLSYEFSLLTLMQLETNGLLKAIEDYGFDTKPLQKNFEGKGLKGFLHNQNIVLQVHPGPIEIIGRISGGIDFKVLIPRLR